MYTAYPLAVLQAIFSFSFRQRSILNSKFMHQFVQQDVIESFTASVSCFGKEIPFDHPKVYLEIDPQEGFIICPYCSKKFELEEK